MSDTCDKCRWYERHYNDVGGECHRYPPATAVMDNNRAEDRMAYGTNFQLTAFPWIRDPALEWCGEFTSRAAESDNGIITEEPTPF